jgi:serine O-acetyltransferase
MTENSLQGRRSEPLWRILLDQARQLAHSCPVLSASLWPAVLERSSFGDALAALMTSVLSGTAPSTMELKPVFDQVLRRDPQIVEWAALDLEKLEAVNPACPDVLSGFLSFRGFQALQLHRLNHSLWADGQQQLAVLLQNWGAMRFSMDIHPAARIGHSVFIDHGIGLVVGSTAVIEQGANIWHGVTLGSTLTQAGDRHPKIRRNATLCAGATILGNIEVGEGSLVAAGSVVLKSVPAGAVVAGIPARVVGKVPDRLDAVDESVKRTTGMQEA